MSYWKWLIRGTGGRAGLYRFFNIWLFLHVGIGVSLAYIVPVTLKEAASNLMLPLAGIFIGLSFAWGGNAQALLQSSEIEEFTKYNPGGFEEYTYTFQTAILVILITLVIWGFAGLNIFDCVWPTLKKPVTSPHLLYQL